MASSLKPIFVLSGFLGSGKTRLLNTLLKRDDFKNTLVIINEFGEVPLDHLLIEESSDTILELSNGCLCCSIRGELIDTLLKLDTSLFDRVIIETTGIANPLPIYQSLAFHPTLTQSYSPAEIITVYDCLRGKDILEQNEEAEKQIAIADIIILSKLDLAKNADTAHEIIKRYNQTAEIIEDGSTLSLEKITQRTIKPKQLSDEHGSKFNSTVLEAIKPLSLKVFAGLLHHLSNTLGEDLLRIKGFANTLEHPEHPVLIQVSGQIVHDFEVKDKWLKNAKTQLVIITKNLDPKIITMSFDAFMNNLAIDTPDQKTILENPLAIPGFEI